MSAPKGYSRSQIRLHWIAAVIVAAQFVLSGPMAAAWQQFTRTGQFQFHPLIAAHVIGGVLVLVIALWRLLLRWRRGVPPLPEGEPAVLKLAAHATHWSLYALMILVPLSGAMAWFGGLGAAAGAHVILKTLLLLLVALHIAAALFHQFVLKTGLMLRMKQPLD